MTDLYTGVILRSKKLGIVLAFIEHSHYFFVEGLEAFIFLGFFTLF